MTAWLLLTFPSTILGMIIIVFPTLLMVLGVSIVRRRVGLAKLAENNESGGIYFSIVGTIYAIFVAFLVVVAWDNLGDAEKVVEQERATVLSLYRDVGGLAAPVTNALRPQIREYAQMVVDREWDQMANGEQSDAADAALDRVWATFLDYEPVSAREQASYREALTELNELGKLRKLRILSSAASIPGVFWFLLLFGGIVTLGFAFFLGMPNLRVQLLMTGVLTAIVMSALFLIVILDRPFTGDVRVDPDSFVGALQQMDRTKS